MTTTHETGHIRNVANFEKLVGFCKSHGAIYNPGYTHIQLATLELKLSEYRNALIDVNETSNAFKNATNDRASKFKKLRPMCTKLINLLMVSGANERTVQDAMGLNRKRRGVRVKKNKIDPLKTSTPTEEEQHQISVSQQSYDQLTGHFSKLVTLLSTQPGYTPNEPEFTIAGLRTMLANLRAANSNVINHYIAVTNSRNERNKLFYIYEDCLYDTAMNVKKYGKAIFGVKSVDFKNINKIRFKRSY